MDYQKKLRVIFGFDRSGWVYVGGFVTVIIFTKNV